ncbi:MAG: (2Fe-2S)-binding protein [Calditrichae bacterium]|nr:(2Fe-2S)-binding protein [Calditrichota bacterium]MCB9059661.1 (2Fe-2S)-binding protein [Calditrichia bacterium]
MSKENNSKDMPRRKFLKNFSSGVIGTSVLMNNLPAKNRADLAEEAETKQTDKGKVALTLTVNGEEKSFKVYPQTTLAQLLRDELGLTGTKIVCNHGECGSCTVILNDQAVYACHLLALDAAGKQVTTIEGLLNGEALHPVQEAFVEKDGLQCGFCTPGQIMAAYALLKHNPKPTHDEIIKGMSGNLCRCAAYPKIIESVKLAAEKGGF